jgi:hypothetical protein
MVPMQVCTKMLFHFLGRDIETPHHQTVHVRIWIWIKTQDSELGTESQGQVQIGQCQGQSVLIPVRGSCGARRTGTRQLEDTESAASKQTVSKPRSRIRQEAIGHDELTQSRQQFVSRNTRCLGIMPGRRGTIDKPAQMSEVCQPRRKLKRWQATAIEPRKTS